MEKQGDKNEQGTEDWPTGRKAMWERSNSSGQVGKCGAQTQLQRLLAPWPGPALNAAARSQLETHSCHINT